MANLSDNQKRFIKTLEVGQVMKAKVMSFSPYGTFVKIGIVNALLHNKDISHDRVVDAEEILEINHKVDVMILKVDYVNYKVQVGIKQTKVDPWEKFIAKYAVGNGVVATVKNLQPYGVFFSLMPGITALLHITEIENKHQRLEDYILDDVHQLIIKSINQSERKIELGIE